MDVGRGRLRRPLLGRVISNDGRRKRPYSIFPFLFFTFIIASLQLLHMFHLEG